MIRKILTAVVIFYSAMVNAAITEAGRGLLFGEHHAFVVNAPAGWLADTQHGVEQGLTMLFYPKGETWPDTSVMVYGRAVSVAESPNVKAQVDLTVQDFHANGSPKYKSELHAPLILPSGKQAQMYWFSGDKWGNYEAAVYFQEADTINYLVFNARSQADFEQYFNDFQKLASSYQNRYQQQVNVNAEKLASLQHELDVQPKEYESTALSKLEPTIAAAKNECVAYLINQDLPAFSYIARIHQAGDVAESYIYPNSALAVCFNTLMQEKQWPEHKLDKAIIKINISVLP